MEAHSERIRSAFVDFPSLFPLSEEVSFTTPRTFTYYFSFNFFFSIFIIEPFHYTRKRSLSDQSYGQRDQNYRLAYITDPAESEVTRSSLIGTCSHSNHVFNTTNFSSWFRDDSVTLSFPPAPQIYEHIQEAFLPKVTLLLRIACLKI